MTSLGGFGLDGWAGGNGGARLLGQPLRGGQDVRRGAKDAKGIQDGWQQKVSLSLALYHLDFVGINPFTQTVSQELRRLVVA